MSSSWHVGCVAYNGDPRLGAGRTGFSFYGTTNSGAAENRRAWLDTCWASNEGANALVCQDFANAKIFSTTFDAPPVLIGGSAAPLTYAPETP